MRYGTLRSRKRFASAVGVGIGLLLVLSLSAIAVSDTADGSCRIGAVLEPLAGILARLDEAIAELESPSAERLSSALEAISDAIDDLLDAAEVLGETTDTEDNWRRRLTRLDLRLHRVLMLVEEVVESAAQTAARERAEERLEELRVWLDSVVFDASAGMSAEEYEQLESAVYQTARRLGQRMMQMAQPEDVTPVLSQLMERLEAQVRRLDQFLLRAG